MSPFGYFHPTDEYAKEKCLAGIMKMIDRLNHQTITDERLLTKYDWLIDEYNRYFKLEPKKRIARMPSAIYRVIEE